MGNDSLIASLAILTLLLAIGFGVWQYLKVQKSKRKNTTTTLGDVDSHGPRTGATGKVGPD